MKPVSLSLRAFGSYAGDLCVDFARLGRHGIFAITGPTGAGKSTIFDALVYALYDDLPGFRVNGNVRSQFADPATETSVSLDFCVHGQRWRIERRPAQLVARQRGSGAPVEKKASVVLGRVGTDGEVVAGSALARARDVAHRVEELVGLTKEQFEQVVLIPQGRFEEVLKAETSKRAPLLRRLFPVEVFTRVTDSLRQIAAARQGAFEVATRQLGAVVGRLCEAYADAVEQVPDELRGTHADETVEFVVEDLAVRLAELQGAAAALDALVVSASTARSEADRARDAGRQASERWKEWRKNVALAASFADEEAADALEGPVLERARRLSDLRAALADWSGAVARLAVLEPERARLLARLDASWFEGSWLDGYDRGALGGAASASQLAGRLCADADHHRQEAERFDKLAGRARALDLRRGEVSERRLGLDERTLKLGAKEVALGLVSEEAERLQPIAAGLDALGAVLDGLVQEHVTARRRAEVTAEVASLSAQLARADGAVDESRAAAMHMRASWRDGLARRLARLLVDGEPCPTCGALEHPAPAVALDDPADDADDDALAAAERACDDAVASLGGVDTALAAAQGVLRGLAPTRALDVVAAERSARMAERETARDAAERLGVVVAEVERRRVAIDKDRREIESAGRTLEIDVAELETEVTALERERVAFVEAHGALVSLAPRAEACAGLARDVGLLAEVLGELETAESCRASCESVLGPLAAELGASGPSELAGWVLDPADVEARARALAARQECRVEVRRKIAEYLTEVGGEPVAPDLDALEAAAQEAGRAHVALVARRGVLAGKLAVLDAGPAMLDGAGSTLDAARRALEQAKTIADQCAGLGGGTAGLRLSLENWVLADYLRQVLVQANHRLDAMTDGRFALQLSDGVTDGRKPWGLDLSVFDVNTGQVRPATTLSGGETFMAALALALGLADVVSGGMGRQIGALFVDEGFGSLDPQSLEGVVDVLRSLEDGGRIVGVISHVDEVKHALPTGITVESSPSGSVATLHYPPG